MTKSCGLYYSSRYIFFASLVSFGVISRQENVCHVSVIAASSSQMLFCSYGYMKFQSRKKLDEIV